MRIKRVYGAAIEDDGSRTLVDRSWPRGVTRGGVRISWPAKELVPSSAVRARRANRPRSWREVRHGRHGGVMVRRARQEAAGPLQGER